MDTRRDEVFLQPWDDGIQFLPRGPGVYCIFNRVTARRYIGETHDIYKRCASHRSELRRGVASNMLMRRDTLLHGAEAFFFFAVRLDGIGDLDKPRTRHGIEVWLTAQFCAHDERYGYNQEAGHHPTKAARFRDRERKLMRGNSRKYVLLDGVDIYDPIHPDLLSRWVPGN